MENQNIDFYESCVLDVSNNPSLAAFYLLVKYLSEVTNMQFTRQELLEDFEAYIDEVVTGECGYIPTDEQIQLYKKSLEMAKKYIKNQRFTERALQEIPFYIN